MMEISKPRKNPIKDFFIFIANDIKKDVEYLEQKFKYTEDDDMPSVELKKSIPRYIWDFICEVPYIITENWMFFLIVLTAFTAGWFVASQYYSVKCNEFFQENCPCIQPYLYDESPINCALCDPPDIFFPISDDQIQNQETENYENARDDQFGLIRQAVNDSPGK